MNNKFKIKTHLPAIDTASNTVRAIRTFVRLISRPLAKRTALSKGSDTKRPILITV